jgi:hypothetical protein
MTYILIAIAALMALGILAALTNLFSQQEEEPTLNQAATCSTCDGNNSQCEQECMMEAAVKPIEYFDDEELDRYQGRASNSFSDEEVEQFAEVLYTLRPHEVAAWSRSLILRGIHVPDPIKDELMMMIDDAENHSSRQ